MIRTALIFGLIAVLIIMAVMMSSMALLGFNESNYDLGEIIGYSSMFIATGITVYLGIKNMRDKKNKGAITLKKGFFTGLSIVITTYVIYTLISFFGFYYDNPQMGEKYFNAKIEEVRNDASMDEAKKAGTIAYYEQAKEIPPFLMAASEGVYMLVFGVIFSVVVALSLKKEEEAQVV